MKNVGDLMQRLQKMMPAHIKPAFKTGEELLAWQKEQGAIRSAALERENRAMNEKGDNFYSNTRRRGGCLSSVCLSEAILYARALAVQP